MPIAHRLPALCVAAGIAGALPAHANTPVPCADREKVIERLAERYGETRRNIGLHRKRGIVEIFASEKTGTWSILITRPDGKSCLIASGEMWEALAETEIVPGKDA